VEFAEERLLFGFEKGASSFGRKGRAAESETGGGEASKRRV